MSTTTAPPFLRLPTDVHLEIFSHCSALALLQLAHTSSILYSEVNGHPAIVRNAFGYWQGYSIPFPEWHRYRHRWDPVSATSSDEPQQHRATNPEKASGDASSDTGTATKYTNVALVDIERLFDPSEITLFHRLYVQGSPDEHKEGRRTVCTLCRNVVQEYPEMHEGQFAIGYPSWETNCQCYDPNKYFPSSCIDNVDIVFPIYVEGDLGRVTEIRRKWMIASIVASGG